MLVALKSITIYFVLLVRKALFRVIAFPFFLLPGVDVTGFHLLYFFLLPARRKKFICRLIFGYEHIHRIKKGIMFSP